LFTFIDTLQGRPNTIRNHASLFRNHVEAFDFDQSDDDEILAALFVNSLKVKNLAFTTQKTCFVLFKKYFRFCKKRTLTSELKIKNLAEKGEPKALDFATARKIKTLCEKDFPDFYDKFLLGLHAGLRRGEVFGLMASDLDFENERIFVRRTYVPEIRALGPTKNGEARITPFSQELRDKLIKRNNVEGVLFNYQDPNPVLKSMAERLEIKPISFHTLRHTFATIALDSGVPFRTVQLWLGHKNPSVTLGTYWSVLGQCNEISFKLP
jgi:integrase